MNRRSFLKTTAVPGIAGAAGQTGTGAKVRRPNVLVLLSDQHRPDLLSCRGSEIVATPNIDRIAGKGVRFNQAFCPAPVCVPSRMSLLTGQYPHRHGAFDNAHSLPWQSRTIAHHFHEQGYVTAAIGKMHFNNALTHGFDYLIGFNDWHSYLGPKAQHAANENHSNWICGATLQCDGCGFPEQPALAKANPWLGHVTRMGKLASDLAPEDHFDAFVSREAAKFMGRHKDEPFFLIAAFLKPHAPFYPPPGFAQELFDPVRMPLRPFGDVSGYPRLIQSEIAKHQQRGQETLRFRRAGQMGCLAFMDWCVGQTYRALEELGLLENTIVVYTSDHGEMDGDHGLYEKGVFFDPAAGVPLIVSYPGRLPQGAVSRGLVEYISLYPTLAELAGLPAPSGLDVRSFAAQARRPETAGADVVHGELNLAGQARLMVRTDRFKYVWNQGDREELYDLTEDAGEQMNRAGDKAMNRTQREMHERLVAWFDPEKNPYRRTR